MDIIANKASFRQGDVKFVGSFSFKWTWNQYQFQTTLSSWHFIFNYKASATTVKPDEIFQVGEQQYMWEESFYDGLFMATGCFRMQFSISCNISVPRIHLHLDIGQREITAGRSLHLAGNIAGNGIDLSVWLYIYNQIYCRLISIRKIVFTTLVCGQQINSTSYILM